VTSGKWSPGRLSIKSRWLRTRPPHPALTWGWVGGNATVLMCPLATVTPIPGLGVTRSFNFNLASSQLEMNIRLELERNGPLAGSRRGRRGGPGGRRGVLAAYVGSLAMTRTRACHGLGTSVTGRVFPRGPRPSLKTPSQLGNRTPALVPGLPSPESNTNDSTRTTVGRLRVPGRATSAYHGSTDR
jgi:hypothetical protein